MKNELFTFIESLRTESTTDTLDAVIQGYESIFEQLSTDDANGKPNGQTVSDPKVASAVNYLQNVDNEYFPETLPPKIQNVIDKSYVGKRLARYPEAGRTSTGKDSINRHQSTYSASDGGSDYAGGSSGYGLGAP